MQFPAGSIGLVQNSVENQLNMFEVNPKTKEIEAKLRQNIRAVFKDYYKPTPQLSDYFEPTPKTVNNIRQKLPVDHHRQPFYNPYYGSRTYVNNYYELSPTKRSTNEDKTIIFLLGIVGIVTAVVGGYFIFQEVKKHTLATDGLNAIKELNKEVKDKITYPKTKDFLASGKCFFEKMEEDFYIWIAIKATIVAGGILMAIGGYISMPVVLTGGVITAAVGLTCAAFRWGFSIDTEMSELALKVLNP